MKISDLLKSLNTEDLLLALSLLKQTDFLEFITYNKLAHSYTLFYLGCLFYSNSITIGDIWLRMRIFEIDGCPAIWNYTLRNLVVIYEN